MIKIIKNTWGYLTCSEKRKFSWLIFFDIAIQLLDILFLALLVWMVQFYLKDNSNNSLSFIPAWLLDRTSILLIGLYSILFCIKNFAGIWVTRLIYHFNSAVGVRISSAKLTSFQSSGFKEFTEIDSSVQVRRINFMPFDYCLYLLNGLQQLLTQALLVFFVVMAIMVFNPVLFLILLAILLPPIIVVSIILKKRLESAKEGVKQQNERSFQYLMDALKGYVESNIYNANAYFHSKYIHYRKKFSRHLSDTLAFQNIPSRIMEVFAILGLLVLIMAVNQFAFQGTLLFITGAYVAAAYKIIPGLVKLVNVSGQMKAYSFLLDEENNIEEKVSSLEIQGIHSIRFKNVNFAFDNRPVLKNINLEVNKGNFLGISAPSGFGKTTLLHILLGFLSPQRGKILVNGRDMKAGELKSIWKHVSYVKQQVFLVNDSILRNITLEEELKNEKRFFEALRISGLEPFVNGLKDGIHHVINENGKTISGGQQQRIALARAFYKDAEIILLDEPCSELDENSEIILMEHFRELAEEGRIIIMITHNKKALDFCHKIIALDEQEKESTGYTHAGFSRF